MSRNTIYLSLNLNRTNNPVVLLLNVSNRKYEDSTCLSKQYWFITERLSVFLNIIVSLSGVAKYIMAVDPAVIYVWEKVGICLASYHAKVWYKTFSVWDPGTAP